MHLLKYEEKEQNKQPMKIITSNMLNGGCGKSSVVLNLSQALREQGKKVLEIDLDFNLSLTHTHQIKPPRDAMFFTAFELFTMPHLDVKKCIINDVIPSNQNLMAIDVVLMNQQDKEHILKRALDQLQNIYDYVLIDTHNAMTITTINALACSDIVIMPMTNDVDCVQGLKKLVASVNGIKSRYNPNLKTIYCLMTMYKNTQLDKATFNYCQTIAADTDIKILPIIHSDVRIAKAKAFNTNVFDYCKNIAKGKDKEHTKGVADYLSVAKFICDAEF